MRVCVKMMRRAVSILLLSCILITVSSEQLYITKKIIPPVAAGVNTLAGIRRDINCVSLCDDDVTCMSGTFNSGDKTCQLYNETVEVVEDEESGITYFEKTCATDSVRDYTEERYTQVLNNDTVKITPSLYCCLSVCTANQSCASVSFDPSTYICATSGEPSVVNYPEDDSKQLTLVKESHSADLTVYEFSTLLARGVVMSQSSKYPGYSGAEKAVDGIYLPSDHGMGEKTNLFHTLQELSPWMQADLSISHYVIAVKVWDRSETTPSVKNRLANVRVTVGESDANFDNPPEDEICNYLSGQPPADIFLVSCHTRMYGRYVRLTAVKINNFLHIYEIEIHGLVLQ